MTPVRSTSRRATARRFSLTDDTRWMRVQRAALFGGVAAAIVAALLQAGVADGIGVGAAIVLAAVAGGALPVRTPARAVLRWDGAQWWWQRAGEPLAVTPGVVIDLEQWMLLRLNAATDADGVRGRAPPERWIALSRRAHESQWASLRLHLFLAAA
ncbi:hypothetical protein ACQ86G_01985 [Roseateles chitinivorans]|uniref:hypothetical protein n=1 Tax=Roseateles chitinivorans TaxID=2917965 RepID=UPI003D67A86D